MSTIVSASRPSIRPQLVGLSAIIALLSVVAAIASPDPLVIALGGLSLGLLVALLWRSALSITLIPLAYQWSEVAVKPILGAVQHRPLQQLNDFGVPLQPGAMLGFLGVTALAAGIAGAGVERNWTPLGDRLRAEAQVWRPERMLRLGCVALVAGYFLLGISGAAGGAREAVLHLANVKFVGLFVIFYWCLVRRSHYHVMWAVLAFEIVTGMAGFFADFRESVLVFIISAVVARPKLRRSDLAVLLVALSLLLALAVFWSAVKTDYRAFVNHGTGAQVVLEPFGRRMQFLFTAITKLNGEKLAAGLNALVARHSYIEFLSLVMIHVPHAVPYLAGAQSWAALHHVLTPRILFPDKAALLSDTALTAYLTGLPETTRVSTSISVGYLSELYADFGPVGALLACGVLGLLVGLGFRALSAQRGRSSLVAAGACITLVLPLAAFELSLVKLAGDLIYSFAAGMIFVRLATPARLRLADGGMRARTQSA